MLGIMSGMHEEIHSPVTEMGDAAEVMRAGMRTSSRGELWGKPAILVSSRRGKVAAATTATRLIARLGVDRVVFTGVAGGVDRALADPAVPRAVLAYGRRTVASWIRRAE